MYPKMMVKKSAGKSWQQRARNPVEEVALVIDGFVPVEEQKPVVEPVKKQSGKGNFGVRN